MEKLRLINYTISLVLFFCYLYQFVYIPISWFSRKRARKAEMSKNKYAVLICARNERSVIGNLIDSINRQTFPASQITVFVMADNCTDDTASVAADHGALVYTRFNKSLVGKGYALQELRHHITSDFPEGFDAYFVFDADNILSPNYFEEMDKEFTGSGNDVITSYRNSTNYGSSWISSAYGLWFLRESRYLNHSRRAIGLSSMVSGTGFMFGRKTAEDIKDWPFHLLTEDIEFSATRIIKGEKIGYCPTAVLYDEQPTTFAQSWKQRKRWSKGYIQVFRKYGLDLLKGVFHLNVSCIDMMMSIMPAAVLTVISILINGAVAIYTIISGSGLLAALTSVGEFWGGMYATVGIIGAITLISEWKNIKAPAIKKILHLFVFPLFMFTYVPISISAFFSKCKWEPIKHYGKADYKELCDTKLRSA